jgi:hypothetical protein
VRRLSPEGVRRLTDHETNKAFERYYRVSIEEIREGYALTQIPERRNLEETTENQVDRIRPTGAPLESTNSES